MLKHHKKLAGLWEKAIKKDLSHCVIELKDGKATEAFKKELLKVLLN